MTVEWKCHDTNENPAAQDHQTNQKDDEMTDEQRQQEPPTSVTAFHLRGAYTASQAAVWLGVCPRTVHNLINAGHLETFMPAGRGGKSGRGRMILATELDRYLTESVNPPESSES